MPFSGTMTSDTMTLAPTSTTVAVTRTTTPHSQPTPHSTQPSVQTVSATPIASIDNGVTELAQHMQSKPSPMFQESTKQNVSLDNSPINPSLPSSAPKQQSASTGASQSTRTYNTHLPYNPSRPPPYTYQRQHEFPPFPPLTQHPILPFLTTAFSSQQEPAPVVAPPIKARPNLAPRASTTQRHVQSTTSLIPTMDVSRNDPAAIFIRPPLVVPFPPNELNLDLVTLNGADAQPVPGTPLTYSILHAHRNWFLDADDFRKDNPNRIDYPSELEPPRGWAPLNECTGVGAATRCRQAKEANEKDKDKGPTARTKGSYAQTETGTEIEYGPSDDCHEKTVLRCTFCRREYHGPNAKSMWRRHVYDKHKVAMKNRREGSAGTAYKYISKKGKPPKPPSPALGPPLVLTPTALDTPTLTLDLTKEQNLIRLLERVVAGNMNISLPSSVLGDGTTNVDIQSIALALEKSGIMVTLDKAKVLAPESSLSSDKSSATEDNSISRESSTGILSLDLNETLHQDTHAPVTAEHQDIVNPDERNATTQSVFDIGSRGQKRKVQADNPTRDRIPLKDNTIANRNQHNSSVAITPGTPRKEKGKQKAFPCNTSSPRIPQAISPVTSPTLNPFTPQRSPCSTAMRARALTTTGQESYLALVLSSPTTASPIRNTGRVTFTSPLKSKRRDCPPPSDDHLGILGTSSPRYSFDFNISGSSPYLGTFDPIPLEVGSLALAPANWTPSSSLDPPVSVQNSKTHSTSRASPYDINVKEDEEGSDMELTCPDEPSSPLERAQRRRPSRESPMQENEDDDDDDFDIDAFVDLKDAGPPLMFVGAYSPPPKNLSTREFSKEFGLLSQEEVERIVGNASSPRMFEHEARSPKRRKVDVTL